MKCWMMTELFPKDSCCVIIVFFFFSKEGDGFRQVRSNLIFLISKVEMPQLDYSLYVNVCGMCFCIGCSM